jgi:hypothetical protein
MNRALSEITLMIFSYLNPVHSICLGLTCKNFYTIHRSIHGTVKVTQVYHECVKYVKGFAYHNFQANHLEEWMKPKWVWSRLKWKYVKDEDLSYSDPEYIRSKMLRPGGWDWNDWK